MYHQDTIENGGNNTAGAEESAAAQRLQRNGGLGREDMPMDMVLKSLAFGVSAILIAFAFCVCGLLIKSVITGYNDGIENARKKKLKEQHQKEWEDRYNQ